MENTRTIRGTVVLAVLRYEIRTEGGAPEAREYHELAALARCLPPAAAGLPELCERDSQPPPSRRAA